MKLRAKFVSNSSSSSFIFDDEKQTVFDIAELMIPQREYGEDEQLLQIIADARKAGVNPNTPIIFSSCNYDTEIWEHNGQIFVESCNNVAWEVDHATSCGDGWDCAEDIAAVAERSYPTCFWNPLIGVIGHETYEAPTNCHCKRDQFCNTIIQGHDTIFCSEHQIKFMYGIIGIVVLGPVRTQDNEIIFKPLVDPCREDEKMWIHVLVPKIGPILYDGEIAHKIMFGMQVGEEIELSTKILDDIQTKTKL